MLVSIRDIILWVRLLKMLPAMKALVYLLEFLKKISQDPNIILVQYTKKVCSTSLPKVTSLTASDALTSIKQVDPDLGQLSPRSQSLSFHPVRIYLEIFLTITFVDLSLICLRIMWQINHSKLQMSSSNPTIKFQ